MEAKSAAEIPQYSKALRMPGRRFSDGDVAMGKWPGSRLYFEAQIVSFDSNKQLYSVKFRDGTEMELKESDIRSMNVFQSKKGSASPSRRRSRSRTRSRSPARTQSRGRSPGRTPKTPQESSPVIRDSRKGDYLKVQLIPLKLQDFNIVKTNGDDVVARRALLRNESPVIQAEEEVKVEEEEQIKNEKVLHYVQRKEYSAESDERDEPKEYRFNSKPAKNIVPVEKPVVEFGGALGAALMMLSMPPFLYYLVHMCAQEDISLWDFTPRWTLTDLWDVTVCGYFALWILLLALFHLLPFGAVFINFIMLLAEMNIQKLESPSASMILVNTFQLVYVLHALWNQESMLTSLDIAYEGFGFMLAFGNLVWVPFAYSLQAAYLVKHPVEISWTLIGAIVAMNILGYIIFRSANNQKNAFRKIPHDPRLSFLKTIPTSCGSQLLVSGWWGFVRHPNYLGDLIMAWAWCLPCGFNDLLPYFYGFFLTGLLLHRVSRVEHQCRLKYGRDWDKYCHLVPYRIIPYVY
ncbi:delta(14)-sterol reductase LBR [Hyla sarda]|uniref:delta(14)-sterol reductase LBR n=1 Tax=Hyla sarda TaxID=327740 RepID=UPI0024C24484|nr:delta(14)-sterol reductase LBR [Hyla sarda]